MQTKLSIIVFFLSSIASMAAPQAAEQTDVPPSVSTQSRKEIRAELAAAKAMGTVWHAEQTYAPTTKSTLSREQVLADLQAWQNAGLSNEWNSDATPDINSAAYRIKQADYEKLAAKPQGLHQTSAL